MFSFDVFEEDGFVRVVVVPLKIALRVHQGDDASHDHHRGRKVVLVCQSRLHLFQTIKTEMSESVTADAEAFRIRR